MTRKNATLQRKYEELLATSEDLREECEGAKCKYDALAVKAVSLVHSLESRQVHVVGEMQKMQYVSCDDKGCVCVMCNMHNAYGGMLCSRYIHVR
jgi:hypothetical protein